MYFRVLIVVTLLKLSECHNNLFGTAELRNSHQRRSRLLSDFANNNVPNDHSRSAYVPVSIPISLSRSLPASTTTTIEPMQPTSSTSSEHGEGPVPTADTMRKYARILKIDAENMNEEQRELLLRIVQRIARLNGAKPDEESIDLNGNEGRARRKHRDDRKKKKPSPSTGSDVVADSTKGTTNTANTKHRTTPSIPSSSGSSKKKVAASNFIAISTIAASTVSPTQPTIPSKVGKSKVTQANDLTLTNATSMDLGNISTTSIVDVLSTDNARENFYIRRPSPSTITTLHNKIQPQKVSVPTVPFSINFFSSLVFSMQILKL